MNQKKRLSAKVCLVPMSQKELPLNALKQYEEFVRKRNSSVLNVNKARNSLWTVPPSQGPFLGKHCHADTAITSVTSNDYTNELGMLAKDILTDDGTVSDSVSQISPMDFPCLSEVSHGNTESVYSKSLVTGRRNSVASSSSSESAHTSAGKKLTASLHLTPIMWDRSGSTGTPIHLECSETMSDMTDDSPSSESERVNNYSPFSRNNLKQRDPSHEEMSMTSVVSGQSDSRWHLDESVFPSSVVSSNDNAVCGCENLSFDLSSYSPPSSPVSDGNESIILNNFPNEVEAPNERCLSGKRQKPMNSNTSLLSPEIKLVPLHEKAVAASKKKSSLSNGIVFRRESPNPLGNLVVKVEDIKEKLKPYAGGGFTLCERGRFTNSGRRVVNDYSEKSLVNASVSRTILASPKVKKRKARCTVQNSSMKKGKKARLQLRNCAKLKNKAHLKYENLKFSEINTVSRMSVRYKVAFQKWGFVFSGALDLINQRLANQNAFWDSLGSDG